MFDFDTDSIKEQLDNNLDTATKSGVNPNKWPSVKSNHLDIGAEILMRLPPLRPDKSPTGVYYNLVHKITHSPSKEPKEILCGKHFDLHKKNSKCVVCDILNIILEHKSEIDKDVLKYVEAAKHDGTFHLPVIAFMECAKEEEKSFTPKGSNEVIKYTEKLWVPTKVSKETEKGFQLVFKMSAGYTVNFLTYQLPKLTGEAGSNYFKLVRTAKYNFEIQPLDKPAQLLNPDILEYYPNYVNYNKDSKLSEIEIQAVFEDCFWWKYVKKYVQFDDGADLSKMAPGEDLLEGLGIDDL